MKLNWGILGTGSIAHKFARGLKACKNGNLVAVGSRSHNTAKAFCNDFGGMPYGSYEDLLGDPSVEAVYIALPHHLHGPYTIKAAQAGKHILCEKPFTLNALEAERALDAVRQADVFFMEAWMYRSHPQTQRVAQLLAEGVIGQPRMVRAEFGYAAPGDAGGFRADVRVGGGALMDVGSYPVSFARLVAGAEPVRCHYAIDRVRGYDGNGQGILEFPGGLLASFGTAVHVNLTNDATICGDGGRIHLPSPWFCEGPILLWGPGADKPKRIDFERVPDLWGNQASIVAQYVDQRQSPTMTWADTLGNMRALDALRASAELTFEREVQATP